MLQIYLFNFSGYAICRYWKSSLQSGLVETLIRISINTWLFTKSNSRVETPKFSPSKHDLYLLGFMIYIFLGCVNTLDYLIILG